MGRPLIVGGYEKYAAFINDHRELQLVHLQWIDYTSTVRVRTLTLKHLDSLIKASANLALCRHYLCLIDIGLPLVDRDPGRPAGQCFLLPDFNTIHLYPGTTNDEQAVVFCYFGSGIPLQAGDPGSPITLAGPFCPRRALLQAIQQGHDDLGLSFRVGFELEFSAVQTGPNPKHEVHASSGLRAIESFMLPILSAVVQRLDAVGVPIEQFHCEGSENAYELVTGHLPPLQAVDALITAKETTRRTCRENDVRLTFNPAPPEINGLHTNLSVESRNQPVEEVEEHFLAGVIEHVEALCAFAMPRPESYARTVAGQWCAGRYVSWGTENREGPIRKRAPGLWEMRLPDASAQMYLFVTGVLIAGMDGIRRKTKLTIRDCQGEFEHFSYQGCERAVDADAGEVDVAMLTDQERAELGVTRELPRTPDEAFRALLEDELLMGGIGKDLLRTYVTIQELYNEKLAEAGPEGSPERKAWLTARI